MTEVVIPPPVAQQAVRHAMANSGYEVGGAFVLNAPDAAFGRVQYRPGVNVAADPSNSIELSAEWIYSLVKDGRTDLLAFFHSHPRGERRPSDHDKLVFPAHYVRTCFIYYGDVHWMTGYNALVDWSVRISEGLRVEVRL